MTTRLTPSRFLLVFFSSIIMIGTLLLSLPSAVKPPHANSVLNALFMSTSAVCVTGLSVVDIGSYYSLFGQAILLLLMQVGALGYMTMATLVALILGKITLKEKLILREIVDISSFEGFKQLLKHTVRLTIVFELIGTLILTVCFMDTYPFVKALYYALFHAVSSFCNAGLSLWSNSLEGFTGDPAVLIVTMLLIVSGGIGYIVLSDLFKKTAPDNRRFSTHSQVALYTSLVLILAGFGAILFSEYHNPATLGNLSFGKKIIASLFQSITPRTAGFNTIGIGSLNSFTLFFLIPLMFIGASPGGTGGGIKTTTFALIISAVWSTLRGKEDINLCKRRISIEVIRKALAIAALGLAVILISTFVLLKTEQIDFLKIFFEITSAFGTVGLSTGITPYLSKAGKLVIIFTMFIGRLGPLTIGMATLLKKSDVPFRFPEEKILIG